MDIKICRCTEADFQSYFEHKSEKSDIYWNGFESAPDKVGLKKAYMSRICEISGEPGTKNIVGIYADGEYAGYLQFTFLKKEADSGMEIELGIGIREKYAGRHIGKYAVSNAYAYLEGLGITAELYSRIRDDNRASQKCFEGAGFLKTEIYTKEKFFPIEEKIILRRYMWVK